jgi:hypothetical protein
MTIDELSTQFLFIVRLRIAREHTGHGFVIAVGYAYGGVVVALLRAAATLGLQVGQTRLATLDFASAGQRHALGRCFARFHLAHYILRSTTIAFAVLFQKPQQYNEFGRIVQHFL